MPMTLAVAFDITVVLRLIYRFTLTLDSFENSSAEVLGYLILLRRWPLQIRFEVVKKRPWGY
jgi:hypothetical protein